MRLGEAGVQRLRVDRLRHREGRRALAQAFGIKTIRDLANHKPFKWARAIVIAADVEE